MIMCIQNLVKFCPFILKIWSKNLILESIKGRNSVANLRKTTIYFTNVDLVNDDVYTKFVLILSIRSQDNKINDTWHIHCGMTRLHRSNNGLLAQELVSGQQTSKY